MNFDYKAYRRPFAKKYLSASDQFAKREGILLRLEDDDGRVGFGEAAPIPSFGTETFPFALAKCEELKGKFEYEEIVANVTDTPSVRFAIESAYAMLMAETEDFDLGDPWPIAFLLADLSDREVVDDFLEQYFRCFKIKIGKTSFEQEWRWLGDLIERLEGRATVRLDANGSLSLSETRLWLERLADWPIDFLEQPMPRGCEDEMLRLASDFPTTMALDESIGNADDLKRWRDRQWPGVFVIKPLLSGSYFELESELKQGQGETHVFSSSLETKVGAWAAIRLAASSPTPRQPLGFGVDWLFADRGWGLEAGAFLQNGFIPTIHDCESLWNQI